MVGESSSGGELWRRGTRVEVSSSKEGFKHGLWFEATLVKPPWKSPFSQRSNKAFETLVTDDDDNEEGDDHESKKKGLEEYIHNCFIRQVTPRECLELSDDFDAFHLYGCWTGVLPSSVFTITFHDKLHLHFLSLRLHLDWIQGKWVRPEKEVITAAEYPKQLGHSCSTTKNTTEAIQLESLCNGTENTRTEDRMVSPTDSGKDQIEQATPCNRTRISTRKKSKQATPSSDATISRPLTRSKKGDTPEYKGGQKIATPSSDATISRPLTRSKKGDTAEYKGGQKIEIGQYKECGTTSTKKKRGKPHKPLAGIKKSSGTDCSSDEVELSKTTNVNPTDAIGKDCSSNEVELPTTTNVNPTGSQDASIGKIAEVSQTDCRREKAKMAITEISFDMTQPLHMCSEGIRSSTKLDDSRFSSGGTVNQLNEANESIVELPLIDCTPNNVLGSNQKLPFVKTSPVWEMIDSMDIFQAMQQYPHFHPLYNFEESSREGLAIGIMVTFAKLVKHTCKLRLDDPRSIWASYMETLFDLEKHGLDVQVLRDRLNEQLVIKDRQEQNLDELKKHEIRHLENVKNNTKTAEAIDKLNENIREFEEKLASAMSIKTIQDSETAALQLRADDTLEVIRITQLDFERVRAAPLLTGL